MLYSECPLTEVPLYIYPNISHDAIVCCTATYVSHDGGRGSQIGPNGSEVERRDGRDEALQRSIVCAVPHVVIMLLRLHLKKIVRASKNIGIYYIQLL